MDRKSGDFLFQIHTVQLAFRVILFALLIDLRTHFFQPRQCARHGQRTDPDMSFFP